MSELYSEMWLAMNTGIQFKNPLSCSVIVGNVYMNAEDESSLKRKYKNYDLPEGFTEKELKELDEFVKERET